MLSESEIKDLFYKYAPDAKSFEVVWKHVKAVEKVAVRIASKCPGVNVEKVRNGALIHDIGRFVAPKDARIKHGIMGAEILRKEGLGEYARFCETHIGAGITEDDIKKQGLPLTPKDYSPKTSEEKIVAHADNLVFGIREVTFEDVLDRYRKELGEEYLKKFIKLKEDVDKLKKI